MKYITKHALVFRGARVERDAEIDVTEAEAANLADDIVPVDGADSAEEPAAEPKAYADMTVAELRDAAAGLGLITGGTKAELLDRLSLHNGETPEEPAA